MGKVLEMFLDVGIDWIRGIPGLYQQALLGSKALMLSLAMDCINDVVARFDRSTAARDGSRAVVELRLITIVLARDLTGYLKVDHYSSHDHKARSGIFAPLMTEEAHSFTDAEVLRNFTTGDFGTGVSALIVIYYC